MIKTNKKLREKAVRFFYKEEIDDVRQDWIDGRSDDVDSDIKELACEFQSIDDEWQKKFDTACSERDEVVCSWEQARIANEERDQVEEQLNLLREVHEKMISDLQENVGWYSNM